MQEDGAEDEAAAAEAETEEGNGGGGVSETPSSAAHQRSASIVGGRLELTRCLWHGVYAITVTGSRDLTCCSENSKLQMPIFFLFYI
jgi:hypothetical protein